MDDASARSDRRVALRLGLVFFVLYALFTPGHFRGSDEWTVFEATQSLWYDGDLSVLPAPHAHRGRDGSLYGHFQPGQSVLALPFFGLGLAARGALPEAWERLLAGPRRPDVGPVRAGGSVEITAVTLYPPFVSGLLVAFFFLFQRHLGATLRSALVASAVLGGATYVVVHATYFLRHATEACALLLALLGIHVHGRTGDRGALWTGCAAACAIPLVRLPAALAAPGLAVLLAAALRERARVEGPARAFRIALGPVATCLALAVAVQVGVNHARWGTWLASPMLDQRVGFDHPILVGLRGFLLSPGTSLFAYSPPLLLAPWAWWRMRSNRGALLAAVGVTALVFLLVSSGFRVWTGLWSAPGPRYVFVLVPLGLLALGPWLDRASSAGRWTLGVLATLGVAVQLGLVGGSWHAVIRELEYERWGPDMGFVWIADKSPIWGGWKVLLQGDLAPWVASVARGWPGQEARPLLAAGLVGLWALGLAVALWSLRAAVRRHPSPGPA